MCEHQCLHYLHYTLPCLLLVLNPHEPSVGIEQSENTASECEWWRCVISRFRACLMSCNTYSNVHQDMWKCNCSSSKICKTSAQNTSPLGFLLPYCPCTVGTSKNMQYLYQCKNSHQYGAVCSHLSRCCPSPKPYGVFPICVNMSDTKISCCVLHVWRSQCGQYPDLISEYIPDFICKRSYTDRINVTLR